MARLPEDWEVNYLHRLKIERAHEKECLCNDARFEIDTNNHWVRCQECGVRIDPFEALLKMARNRERLNEEMKEYLKDANMLRNYKPVTKTIQKIENVYMKNEYLPRCPHCSDPFKLEQLAVWTPRGAAEQRIKTIAVEKERKKREDNN